MSRSVLLVGLGQIAMGYDLAIDDPAVAFTHARAFDTHPGFFLAAGIDNDDARCKTFSARYGVAASAKSNDTADVAVIATPTETHAAMLGDVLNRKNLKAVLCEKPLSYDLSEARGMVKLARDIGCPLYVNYLRRSAPAVRAVKQRIASGEIAAPFKGVAWYSKGLLHSGSHLVNMLEYWLGAIRGFQVIDKGGAIGAIDCEPDVRIDFAAGAVTLLVAREENFSLHEVELVAANGRLRHTTNSTVWQAAVSDPGIKTYRVLAELGQELAFDTQRGQWHVADQLAAALDGRDATLCSGEEALTTLEWLIRIREAT